METEKPTKERPIIFTAESVKAILAGAKTMTRRVVWPQPPENSAQPTYPWMDWQAMWPVINGDKCQHGVRCPYPAGSRLWVRERFAGPMLCATKSGGLAERYYYAATEPAPKDHRGRALAWRSPIFMPRAAARLLLEVTEVRVERVQVISEADARAEGCGCTSNCPPRGCSIHQPPPSRQFARRWDAINKAKGFSWASDPWCWVVSFKRSEA